MNNLKRILVLDTEYETCPKRLIAIAYCIYNYIDEKWIETQYIDYIKHDEDIVKINENSDAFKAHKLTTEYLNNNGINIITALNNFYYTLVNENISIIIGQNILRADIDIIRKEAIGEKLWFNKIKKKLDKCYIYDTMISFKKKNPTLKASLNLIYENLFNEKIINHHNPIYDCKNTFKCFIKMLYQNYDFKNIKLKFSEDIFLDKMKLFKKCNICENKIVNNVYKLKRKKIKINNECMSIVFNLLNINDIICSSCFNNIELLVKKNEKMLNIKKLKYNYNIINKFFDIEGDQIYQIYLQSEYNEKDEIKKLGGKWDKYKRKWFFTYKENNKIKIMNFIKWIKLPESSIVRLNKFKELDSDFRKLQSEKIHRLLL